MLCLDDLWSVTLSNSFVLFVPLSQRGVDRTSEKQEIEMEARTNNNRQKKSHTLTITEATTVTTTTDIQLRDKKTPHSLSAHKHG